MPLYRSQDMGLDIWLDHMTEGDADDSNTLIDC